MKTFAIGPFTAQRVALDSGATVSGLPAPTAIAGLSDAIARGAGRPAANMPFAVILHDVQPSLGRFKPKADHHGRPGEAVERLSGRVQATLILLDEADVLTRDDVVRSVPGCRFAGGYMDLDPQRIRKIDDLGHTLRRLPPGHVLLDRSDLLEDAVGDATDPLDGLLNVFTWHRDPEGGLTNRFTRDAEGRPRYLVPLAVGYQAIEPIKATRTRHGTRSSEIPHVFVEGIASVGQLISSRKLARDASAVQSRDMFWSWEIDRSVGTIRVRGRPLQTV